jgi:hypothetical protein
MSDLFQFIDTMFAKPAEFKKTKLHERAKHFFMINRFMAIMSPVRAAYFNHIKINPGQVVTYWQESLGGKYSRTPKWMYVKTKKAKEAAKAKQPFTDDIISLYCEKFQMSRRDFDTSMEILGDDFIQEVQSFQSIVSQ